MAGSSRRLLVRGQQCVLERADQGALVDALLALDRLDRLDDLPAHRAAPLLDQVAAEDLVVRNLHGLVVRLNGHRTVVRIDHFAAQPPALVGAQLHLAADGVAEVLRLAERALDTGDETSTVYWRR